MRLVVRNTLQFSGKVVVPSSKSQSIRGLFFGLLAKGRSVLKNILDSSDVEQALQVCQAFGVKITTKPGSLMIDSSGVPFKTLEPHLKSGNSGITTRFLMPILGLRQDPKQTVLFDCGTQMRGRPIQPLVLALRDLGLSIDYAEQEGMLPVRVSGMLKGGVATVEGITSQYLSSLLMSLPLALEDSHITVYHLHERPYMEMTLSWLQKQKIQYTHEKFLEKDIFHINGGQQYHAFETTIQGDFSSASYLIAAAVLLPGRVELEGLDMEDPQGDKRLISILQEMGASISVFSESNRLVIQGGGPLKGMKIDANDIPDLVPTLAVIGTAAIGKTEIVNVAQARIKETDRIHSMTIGLRSLGAKVEEHAAGLTVYQSSLKGSFVSGFDDHRTVMALALAGMLAQGETNIEDGQAIDKTFPTFVEVMQSLGANMTLEKESEHE